MTDDSSFVERLNNLRNQNECEFNRCLDPDKTWCQELELLNDIVYSHCSANDPCDADLPEKLAYLGLTVQNLWGSLKLASQGLYSSAQALLRCAMEHQLRWEFANSQKGFPAVSCRNNRWYAEPDCQEPYQLRDKVETDLWYHEGLCAIYSVLTDDIHLKIGTLNPEEQKHFISSRLSKVMSLDDTQSQLSVNMFGRFDLQDTYSFYLLWNRLCCRVATKNIEIFRQLKECFDQIYPFETQLNLAVDLKELVEEMWIYPPKQKGLSFLDLSTGKINQKVFPPEDSSSVLLLQVPICDRDPLVRVWRNGGQLPIPRCSLHIKWKMVERFKEKNKLSFHSQYFADIESYLEKVMPADWISYRNQCLVEWLHHFNVYPQ